MSASKSREQRFPEVFNQTSIDPRTRTRKVEMKILCIGMMRTGTMSLKAAFEKLGYRDIYHMVSAIQNPPDYDMWMEAIDAKFYGKGQQLNRDDWDSLLGNCMGCIDLPAAAFMPELIEAYPEAKVIVSMRDPDKWLLSVTRTAGQRVKKWQLTLLRYMDPFYLKRSDTCIKKMFGGLFGSFDDAETVKKTYVALYEEVRRLVPPHRILEYDIGDGWEPLCKFLDQDIPKEPFPFINDSKDFNQRSLLLHRQAYARILKKTLSVGVLAVALCWYFDMAPVSWARDLNVMKTSFIRGL